MVRGVRKGFEVEAERIQPKSCWCDVGACSFIKKVLKLPAWVALSSIEIQLGLNLAKVKLQIKANKDLYLFQILLSKSKTSNLNINSPGFIYNPQMFWWFFKHPLRDFFWKTFFSVCVCVDSEPWVPVLAGWMGSSSWLGKCFLPDQQWWQSLV